MSEEHKKTLWLMLAMVAVFGLLFFMVSGESDRLLGSLLPGYAPIDDSSGGLRKPAEVDLEDGVDYKARLVTSSGDIVIDLYELDTPYTVTNFVYLSEKDFYDGLTFHRVVEDVLIQTGDPEGDGSGGPGYTFEDEIRSTSVVKGSVAMASSKPDSNGSQFFIVTKEAQPHLDREVTVFGEVEAGMDTVTSIASVAVQENDSGEVSKPVNDVVIEDVEIIKEEY